MPLLFVALSFQNCAEVKFSDGAELVPKPIDDDIRDGLDIDPDDPDTPPAPGPGDKDKDSDKDHDRDRDHDADDDGDVRRPPGQNRPPVGVRPPVMPRPGHGSGDGQNFVCILEGPGKSMKLGLIDNELRAKRATPSSVCMTKHACLNLVSQRFGVKSAKKVGFCKGNGAPKAHTIRLSDDEILELLN